MKIHDKLIGKTFELFDPYTNEVLRLKILSFDGSRYYYKTIKHKNRIRFKSTFMPNTFCVDSNIEKSVIKCFENKGKRIDYKNNTPLFFIKEIYLKDKINKLLKI